MDDEIERSYLRTVELPQDQVDAIIRTKRKARDPKACYACHRRKVKCDRQLPCDSCVKRDHPELCSYERPSKRRQLAINPRSSEVDHLGHIDSPERSPTSPRAMQLTDEITIPREEWEKMYHDLRAMQETIHTLRAQSDGLTNEDKEVKLNEDTRTDDSEREGIHAPSGQMGTMHLGSRSVLAYMHGLGRTKESQEAAQTLLEENILPKLGLDNESATYPFVDLWSTNASSYDVGGLCKLLPNDDSCVEHVPPPDSIEVMLTFATRFFVFYRDVACTIYPVVPDTKAFERKMSMLLQNRIASGGEHTAVGDGPEKPFGVSLSWLALLFAVLASGSLSSDRPPKERELTSQVYICCSYHALRMTNFMTHPSLDAIQAFLIIGNVLSYNMNPGVAYILLGMTMRMAFSIGLQTESHQFRDNELYLRRRVWWALAWQDSHFSMSYDRPSASAFCGTEIPYLPASMPGHRSYPESMFQIIKLTQEIIQNRILNPRSNLILTAILGYKEEVARIVADGSIHLRDRRHCTDKSHHLERLALKLHASYITSELCRPALKEPKRSGSASTVLNSPNTNQSYSTSDSPTSAMGKQDSGEATTFQLRLECIRNLQETIEAYVEAHSISKHASRSWIGIQRAISAAFLLGVLPESHTDPQVHDLLRRLEEVISERTKMEKIFLDARDLRSPRVASALPPTSAQVDGESMFRGVRNSLPGIQTESESPNWARSMTKSLKALSKMNAALATPRISNAIPGAMQSKYGSSMPSKGPLSSVNSFRPGQLSPGNSAFVMPATPDSSASSTEWNYGNLPERAAEYVQPPLWS